MGLELHPTDDLGQFDGLPHAAACSPAAIFPPLKWMLQ